MDSLQDEVIRFKTFKKSVKEEERLKALMEAEDRAQARILEAEIELAQKFQEAMRNGVKASTIRRDYLRTQDWSVWNAFRQHFDDGATPKPGRPKPDAPVLRTETHSWDGDTLLWHTDKDGNRLGNSIRINIIDREPLLWESPDWETLTTDYVSTTWGSPAEFDRMISKALEED